ncbi:MAG: DNA polymerase III subunit gamma/tau, partial [Burkholderiaceae bacterium]
HRGVEEMAQLLENAIYAPSLGRWKVYVIDEVHMLSNHAFNAMLKTLEEPPGHVVFVLATPDPQKVPVTVLSRCLQLSLRNMSPQAIAEHLSTVLHEEQIAYESDALNQIAKSAAGSMRDALSLLDQAISHGAGEVRSAEVLAMLGAIDRDKVAQIMEALLDANPRQLCALAEEVCALGVDAAAVLQALAQLVQDLSLLKLDALESDDPQLRRWADACEAEQLQVYWQILLHGRRDLSLAPDQQAGLTMTLLRLHAFRPLAFRASATQAQAVNHGSTLAPDVRPVAAPAKRAAQPIASSVQREASEPQSARQPLVRQPLARQPSGQDATVEVTEFKLDCEWSELATRIPCSGFVRQFLEQSELLAIEGVHIRVRVPIRPLAEQATVNKVKDLLVGHFQVPLRLSAEVGSVGVQTAASIHDAQRRAERDAALQGLQSDPFVQAMVNELGAQIDPDSVQARKH